MTDGTESKSLSNYLRFEDFRLIVDNQDELLHTDVLSVTRKDVEFLMKLRQKANKGKEVFVEEKLPTFKFFLPYQAKKDEWQHYYVLRLVSEKWVGIEYVRGTLTLGRRNRSH